MAEPTIEELGKFKEEERNERIDKATTRELAKGIKKNRSESPFTQIQPRNPRVTKIEHGKNF